MDIRSSRRQFLQVGRRRRRRRLRRERHPTRVCAARRIRAQVSASDRVRFGMIGVGMQGSGLLARSIALPGRRVRRRLRSLRRTPRARA